MTLHHRHEQCVLAFEHFSSLVIIMAMISSLCFPCSSFYSCAAIINECGPPPFTSTQPDLSPQWSRELQNASILTYGGDRRADRWRRMTLIHVLCLYDFVNALNLIIGGKNTRISTARLDHLTGVSSPVSPSICPYTTEAAVIARLVLRLDKCLCVVHVRRSPHASGGISAFSWNRVWELESFICDYIEYNPAECFPGLRSQGVRVLLNDSTPSGAESVGWRLGPCPGQLPRLITLNYGLTNGVGCSQRFLETIRCRRGQSKDSYLHVPFWTLWRPQRSYSGLT